MPGHRLSCDNFSFLDSKIKEAPSKLDIERLDFESNEQNRETTLSELKTAGSLSETSWKQVDKKTLQLSSVKNAESLDGDFFIFTFFSSLNMQFRKSSGDSCQIPLPVDFTAPVLALIVPMFSTRLSYRENQIVNMNEKTIPRLYAGGPSIIEIFKVYLKPMEGEIR